MAKKHEENRDLRSVGRIAKINPSDRSIQCSKSAVIGIHMWGKIDFLTKYCGWHFIWNNNAGVSYIVSAETNKPSRAQKKAKKEPKLTDKTKKGFKKK